MTWNELELTLSLFSSNNHFFICARWGSLQSEKNQLIFSLCITSHSFPPMEEVFNKILENRNTLGLGPVFQISACFCSKNENSPLPHWLIFNDLSAFTTHNNRVKYCLATNRDLLSYTFTYPSLTSLLNYAA